jgi:CheY-like chemotaxis protein
MNQKKILVVDDEASIQMLFELALSLKGYEVITSSSGEEAIEILDKESIFVMFLDLNLSGMTGIELFSKIMKITPITLAFAMGYSSHFELSDCKDTGFEDYYVKPVPLKEIIKAVSNAFT